MSSSSAVNVGGVAIETKEHGNIAYDSDGAAAVEHLEETTIQGVREDSSGDLVAVQVHETKVQHIEEIVDRGEVVGEIISETVKEEVITAVIDKKTSSSSQSAKKRKKKKKSSTPKPVAVAKPKARKPKAQKPNVPPTPATIQRAQSDQGGCCGGGKKKSPPPRPPVKNPSSSSVSVEEVVIIKETVKEELILDSSSSVETIIETVVEEAVVVRTAQSSSDSSCILDSSSTAVGRSRGADYTRSSSSSHDFKPVINQRELRSPSSSSHHIPEVIQETSKHAKECSRSDSSVAKFKSRPVHKKRSIFDGCAFTMGSDDEEVLRISGIQGSYPFSGAHTTNYIRECNSSGMGSNKTRGSDGTAYDSRGRYLGKRLPSRASSSYSRD